MPRRLLDARLKGLSLTEGNGICWKLWAETASQIMSSSRVFHWFTLDSFLVPFRIQRNSWNLVTEVPPRFYQTHDLNPMMMSRSMEATVCFGFKLVSNFPNTRELLSWKFSREAYLLVSFSSSSLLTFFSLISHPTILKPLSHRTPILFIRTLY